MVLHTRMYTHIYCEANADTLVPSFRHNSVYVGMQPIYILYMYIYNVNSDSNVVQRNDGDGVLTENIHSNPSSHRADIVYCWGHYIT